MSGSAVPTVAWLGLIWSTWQVLQIALRTLSKEQDDQKESDRHKIAPTLFQYLVGLAVFFTVIQALQTSPMMKWLLVLAAAVLTLAFLVWEYRLVKTRPGENGRISQVIGVISCASFVTACVTMIMSLDLLYRTGYLWGAYDELSFLVKAMGIPVNVDEELNRLIPNGLATARTAVPLCLLGIAMSTLLIALFAYRQGLIRGRKQTK